MSEKKFDPITPEKAAKLCDALNAVVQQARNGEQAAAVLLSMGCNGYGRAGFVGDLQASVAMLEAALHDEQFRRMVLIALLEAYGPHESVRLLFQQADIGKLPDDPTWAASQPRTNEEKPN